MPAVSLYQAKEMEMIGVLGHDSALQGYTGTWANEMNFGMKCIPQVQNCPLPGDLQSNALSLC